MDDQPKTRTERKRQGKKDVGPYSAKHVRLAAAASEKTNAKTNPKTNAKTNAKTITKTKK